MIDRREPSEAMIEAGRAVLWDCFCPGIRREAIDDEHYNELAKTIYLAMRAKEASPVPSDVVERLKAAIREQGVPLVKDAAVKGEHTYYFGHFYLDLGRIAAALKDNQPTPDPPRELADTTSCGVAFQPTKDQADREALLREAAEPWSNYHGDLPDYDHPLRPVFESGIQYAVELLAKTLGVDDWEICDGTEEFDGDLGGTLLNIVIKTWPTDEHGDWLDFRDPNTRASSASQRG